MRTKKKYQNRDISWLSFNYRVLEEAKDKSVPLYERLKFLAIYSSNLDEFYKVRVASYRRLLSKSKNKDSDVKDDPEEILNKILEIVNKQQQEFGQIFWKELIPELKENNILLAPRATNKVHRDFINTFFYEQVIPYLHPVLVMKGKVLPFLRDDALYLAIKMFKKTAPQDDNNLVKKARYALVNIPTDHLPRFIELPARNEQHHIMFLDDLIKGNLNALFPGYEIESSYCIKLSRDADLGIEDEFTGDLPDKIDKSLVKRKTGMPSRFLYDNTIPEAFLKTLRESLKLSKRDLVPGGKYHNFSNLFSFPNPLSPGLEDSPLPALHNKGLRQYDSMFDAMREKDWILHFPYQSYDPVIQLFNEAAFDPDVKEIKATQYRVASDSAIVNALVNAVRNGKKVTVFVEVKARFDEYANLQFAKVMKKAGVKIIYSIPGLKVHAKVALITRKSGKKNNETFAFLSTGNFNEKTARIYADHGLFTGNKNITGDLKNLFRFLENQDYQFKPRHALIAQFNIKDELTRLINTEIEHAEQGKPAWIILKMNGLDNRKMIDKLYEASRKGVKIDLIIRGICCLIPEKKYSKNITITRIIDRYLEHARVFVFHHGGDQKMFMASADLMNRNLNRRIELAFPIYDKDIKAEVMQILKLQLSDNTKARILDKVHNNLPPSARSGDKIRAQTDTYNMLKKINN